MSSRRSRQGKWALHFHNNEAKSNTCIYLEHGIDANSITAQTNYPRAANPLQPEGDSAIKYRVAA